VRKSLLFSVVLTAFVVLACGAAGGATAATVNGVNISVGEVQMMRLNADPEAAVIDKAQFAQDLTDAIINLAIIDAARDEFQIDPTEEQVTAKIAELEGQIQAAQGMTATEFFAQQGLPAERLTVIARQQVIKDALDEQFLSSITPATDADAELLLTTDRVARTTACVSHILVATEDEANVALDRINGGEDFAVVAQEVGTDGTAANGGELGCESLGLYVPEFADAAYGATVGEVTGPVESQFGFHLVLVSSREEPSLEEIKADIDLQRVNEEVGAWILESIKAADVTVEAEFGTWVTDPTPQVQAPIT
jgi:parvulin-like peptidyl-prolyl isomerase